MPAETFFNWVSAVTLLASSAAMAEPGVFVLWKDGSEVVLFDAGRVIDAFPKDVILTPWSGGIQDGARCPDTSEN
jgi:hypothetical protein